MSDIPEADMPSRKRLCLTAPASRFEVGESSTATATRQIGHTLACRVDYGCIDTLDVSIRASEGRVMTTVEEAVYARHAWSCLEDRSTALKALIRAQEARITALEARITTLQIQHGRMEWQRQEVGDMVTRAFGHIHALEARDPAHPYDLEDTGY
ncbi:hypothetical protein Tco_0446702 [Tanacetum coccineum]